ncbi:hypothetical protein DAMA08_043580 [Martiniozyma asiatica (nom. inval.)]|nr:hypothetical protein DAMA08_043580 [Martiniozyma asiatica]
MQRANELLRQLDDTDPQSLQFLPLRDEFVSIVHTLDPLDAAPMKQRLTELLRQKNAHDLEGAYGVDPFSDTDNIEPMNKDEYTQQLLQEQDTLISTQLTKSINTLHQQALSISQELEDQSGLLQEVDYGMDRLNFKIVNQGMEKMNKFLATNEWGGNCCIGLLIVVLVILLVALIIV